MPDSEKLTININFVDLGQIDLLVEQGMYSNRSDFIRTAIRNQLNAHSDVVKQTISRDTIGMGVLTYGRRELESLKTTGKVLDIKWVGLMVINEDVPAQLALDTIQSLRVYGVLRASSEVKEALATRLAM